MERIKYQKIIIPYAPDSMNKVVKFGSTVGDITALKHKWQDIASIYLQDALVEGIIPDKFKGLLTFKFKLFFETKRRRDEDNYYIINKAIIDEFVRSGFIEDDNSELVHFGGAWLHVDPISPRVEIYLTEYLRDDQVVNINYYGSDNQTILSAYSGQKAG